MFATSFFISKTSYCFRGESTKSEISTQHQFFSTASCSLVHYVSLTLPGRMPVWWSQFSIINYDTLLALNTVRVNSNEHRTVQQFDAPISAGTMPPNKWWEVLWACARPSSPGRGHVVSRTPRRRQTRRRCSRNAYVICLLHKFTYNSAEIQ